MPDLVREFTVRLSDRPGALAEVTTALGQGGVNLAGFLGYGRGGPSELRFIAQDPAKAEAWLKQQGWTWKSRDAVAVAGVDEPGFMGKAARRIGDAGVNIEATYIAFRGKDILVVFSAEDAKTALKALA